MAKKYSSDKQRESISANLDKELKELINSCIDNTDNLFQFKNIKANDEIMIDIMQSDKAQIIISQLFNFAIKSSFEMGDEIKAENLEIVEEEYENNLATLNNMLFYGNAEELNKFFGVESLNEEFFEEFSKEA